MQQEVRRFVPRTLPPVQPGRTSRAAREREAKTYWDSLSPEQEAWALTQDELLEVREANIKRKRVIDGHRLLRQVREGSPGGQRSEGEVQLHQCESAQRERDVLHCLWRSSSQERAPEACWHSLTPGKEAWALK